MWSVGMMADLKAGLKADLTVEKMVDPRAEKKVDYWVALKVGQLGVT